MPKQLIDLPDPPEGFAYTGELRRISPGDWYLHSDLKAMKSEVFSEGMYLVLEKVAAFVPLEPSDFLNIDWVTKEGKRWFRVVDVDPTGSHSIKIGNHNESLTPEQFMEQGWKYFDPADDEWKECRKEAAND